MIHPSFLPAAILMAAFPAAASQPAPVLDPASLKDTVSIKPGNSFIVLFQREGDRLGRPKIVEKPEASSPSISFKFERTNGFLMLCTQNGFDKTLRFRALMKLKGRADYVETNILPLMAKLASYESWQDPVEELVLFEFKLTDEKAF